MTIKRLLTLCALTPILGLAVLGARPAAAEGPTVVELFTSQGCYSCPPAERFLGELAGREDVLALEFHVDYWDDLVYGSAGKWKDPFSNHDYTLRQRDYNLKIRRRAGVYTPQMVIDGRLEAVGSRTSAVERAIREARSDGEARIAVAIDAKPGAGISVRLADGPHRAGTVYLVSFRKAEVTRVLRGENQGKTLKSHNVVTDLKRIGRWTGSNKTIDVGYRADAGQGCAVIVQAGDGGPILGAAACPMLGS